MTRPVSDTMVADEPYLSSCLSASRYTGARAHRHASVRQRPVRDASSVARSALIARSAGYFPAQRS
jgi:hypothetical protein